MNKKIFYVFGVDFQLLSHRKELVRAVAERYDVTVITRDTGRRQEIIDLGVRFIDLPIDRTGTNVLQELRTLRFLHRLYRHEKPDLVHHVSLKVVVWGGLAAKWARVPHVVNAVNGLGVLLTDGKVGSSMQRGIVRLLRHAHRRPCVTTIFQNDEDKALFLAQRILTEAQTYFIKGSGVDLQHCADTPPVEKPCLEVVFTARMLVEKGVLDLVEAAELLRGKYAEKVVFLLYGGLDTNPNAVGNQQLEALCDDRYIRYMGHENDIRGVLMRSDIVAMPSYYREGVPKSLIEATAVGRPILTADSVGCRETVTDGHNGFLVPPRSPEAIAGKLSLLFDDPALRVEMGRRSRKMAENLFSLEEVLKRHIDLYDNELR